MAADAEAPGIHIVVRNRRARHEYEVLERMRDGATAFALGEGERRRVDLRVIAR